MAIARFDFAVDRRGSREGEPNADFFRCTAFDRKAELLERFGRKGLKLLLTGKMQNNNYTNKEGVKVYSMQYLVDDVEFAESKKNSSEDGRNQETPPVNQQSQPAQRTQPAQSSQPAQRSQPSQSNQAPSRQPARQAARSTARSSQRNAPAASKDDFMNIDDGMDDGNLPFNLKMENGGNKSLLKHFISGFSSLFYEG